MKKSAMKGILFLSIIFMSISLHGANVTGDDFFSGTFADSNLTITTTKQGTTAGAGVDTFQSTSFNGHNTLNINISNNALFKRNTQRGMLRIGTMETDRDKTLNITASGNINRLFNLAALGINGNAYAAVISPRFVLDASRVTDPNFQAFYTSVGNYSHPYLKWPVTASISFGSDVIVSGLSGNQKFAMVEDGDDNGANASLWLNHRGAIRVTDNYRNYWGDNIDKGRSWVGAPVPSDIFAKASPRTGLNNYQTTKLDKMLKISGDIIINGSSFTGARMYANFISTPTQKSHYYGDMSGTGNIYANFINADFKGNNGVIGNVAGSIQGNGIREVAFVFRDNVAAKEQFDLTINNANAKNKWYIENANINGGAISTAGDVWNAFAGAGINFTGRKDSNLTFTKSSIEVTSGTLTGSFTGYFGNKSHTMTDWWGNAQTSTNYTKTYTLRKAGSTVDANVSDANIGTASDNAKKLVYFLYTPNTFTDATGKITDFGYTGTILGGTADSVYHFDNAGYIYQNQLNRAIGRITLSGNTRYADMVYGDSNIPVNVALDMGASNPNRGNGSVVGSNPSRKVELDFSGITTHKDIFFNILGSGKGEYTISNLKNVSTTMTKGDRFDTTTIRKDLEYTNSILGVLGNAGVGVFTSRPATDPPNITPGTDLNGISADSKFILRGTSISGDLRDGNYSYDFVFDSTSGYKGQSGLRKNIESSFYDGNEIDLGANNRDQKLHFIGADSITKNRLKLTLGAGAHDIAFVGLSTEGATKTIELDASRSIGGAYTIHGVDVINSGGNHILPTRDANISINNATLTLSNMTGDQTAIDGQNNTLKSDLSGVNISLSTIGGTATAIKLRDNSINLNGNINLNGTNTTAIDYIGTAGTTNTINITDTANINANYGIIANLNAGSMLNINNTGLLQTDIRDIKLSGNGDANLGVYHTKLRDFTTDITAFDPTNNNGLHSIEMTNTNSINFDKELIFTSMDNTESFYLQDMVTVDGAGTSAIWNPNSATRTPGSVSASPNLNIQGPLEMFKMELDRGTGLVVVGVDPNLAPTTTFSKIILGTLESGGNKIESDVGNYLFNMSRGRYLTSTQQKVWKDNSRTQALRMAMNAKNENPNIPYNKVSTKFTKEDKKIDTANALEYLLYERHNRVEMFVEPYYMHSTLNDKDVSGKMSGYGLNGGMSINIIPQWILGWHVGLDTRTGTGKGAASTRASTTNFVTLNTGIHTRLNLGHINQTRLVYVRGNALYQRTQAKQNTDLIGDSLSLNNNATALKFDALLGMEQSTKSGDVVALELGVSKYDMTFSKESFKTGPNSEFVMDSVKKDMLYILANLRYARMYRNAMVFISPNISLGVKVLANEMNFSPELRFGAVSFVPEVSLNRFSGILDIGVDMITLGRSLTLGARYIGEYGQFMITHSVQGKVGYRF